MALYSRNSTRTLTTSKSKHRAERRHLFISSLTKLERSKLDLAWQMPASTCSRSTAAHRFHQKTSPRNAAAGAGLKRRSQKFVSMSAQRSARTGPVPSSSAVSVFLTHFLHSGRHPCAEMSLHRHFGGIILLQIPQSSQHGHEPGVPTHV